MTEVTEKCVHALLLTSPCAECYREAGSSIAYNDSDAHALSCKRWFQYDDNHKRYIPDQVCTCGAADRAVEPPADFNPDRLITEPRTLGEVYAKEARRALITECCNMAIGPDCRFCPKCGYEARVNEPPAPAQPAERHERWIKCQSCKMCSELAKGFECPRCGSLVTELVDAPRKSNQTATNQPAETPAAMEWQPIETAPKDGTMVLLMSGGWRHPFVGQVLESGMVLLDVPTAAASTLEMFATYWMPLPDPPIDSEIERNDSGDEATGVLKDSVASDDAQRVPREVKH